METGRRNVLQLFGLAPITALFRGLALPITKNPTRRKDSYQTWLTLNGQRVSYVAAIPELDDGTRTEPMRFVAATPMVVGGAALTRDGKRIGLYEYGMPVSLNVGDSVTVTWDLRVATT